MCEISLSNSVYSVRYRGLKHSPLPFSPQNCHFFLKEKTDIITQ